MQDIGRLWIAVQRIRQEFRHAALHHPISFSSGTSQTGTTTLATAKIMLPALKSKVELAFEVDANVLDRWPLSLNDVAVTANVIYGQAE